MIKTIWTLICGMVFGVANVIPGVSGGTMAVVMGFYDTLIESVGNFFKDWKKHIKFLVPFVAGVGLAILLFSKLVQYLLGHFQMQVNFFFLGLIIGSIPLIAKKASAGDMKGMRFVFAAIGLAVMILMTFLSPSQGTQVFTTLTIGRTALLVASGFIAAVTTVIPGISGSMMLLIIGVYHTVLGAVSDLNIILLIPAGIGILLGLIFGTKLIAFMLSRYTQATYCVILGLVIGSTIPVFMESGFRLDLGTIAAVISLVVGALIAWIISRDNKFSVKEQEKA